MKNHTIQLILPAQFAALRQEALDKISITPYLPTVRLYEFLMTICGRKGYGNKNENWIFFIFNSIYKKAY